jgi:hypothetical protein
MSTLLPELWRMIMTYLGPCSLLRCASVCRRWCEWARDERNWARHRTRVGEKLGMLSPMPHPWRFFAEFLLLPLSTPLLWSIKRPNNWIVNAEHRPREHRYMMTLSDMDSGGCRSISISDEVAPEPGVRTIYLWSGYKCLIQGDINPMLGGRYHTIVRDSDYGGPRDERYWLTITNTQ